MRDTGVGVNKDLDILDQEFDRFVEAIRLTEQEKLKTSENNLDCFFTMPSGEPSLGQLNQSHKFRIIEGGEN